MPSPPAPPPTAQPMAGGVVGGVAGGAAGYAVSGRGGASRPGVMPAPYDTATYAAIDENTFRRVADHPLSTFSIDVDTASYANVRRFLTRVAFRRPTPCASRS